MTGVGAIQCEILHATLVPSEEGSEREEEHKMRRGRRKKGMK